jgi:2Fe-2S ferredoxin
VSSVKSQINIQFLNQKTITISSEEATKTSLLDIALSQGVNLDHACGGVCACSTCHIIVTKGFNSLNPISENEDDQLDEAPGLTTHSRLACQTIANGSEDLDITIPSWNRNIVKEKEHD